MPDPSLCSASVVRGDVSVVLCGAGPWNDILGNIQEAFVEQIQHKNHLKGLHSRDPWDSIKLIHIPKGWGEGRGWLSKQK